MGLAGVFVYLVENFEFRAEICFGSVVVLLQGVYNMNLQAAPLAL